MADIDSQVSFSVKTDSGEVRSMTPEEINSFVRQKIELASSRKGTTTLNQQTRRMRLARTPSPMSRFGRTNSFFNKTTESKANGVDSSLAKLSLDEASLATPRDNPKSAFLHSPSQSNQQAPSTVGSTGLYQSTSQVSLRGSMEDERRSLSVDRERQTSSPDRREGIEERRDSPEFIPDAGRKTNTGPQFYKVPELQIKVPTSPKKGAQSPEDDNTFHDGTSSRCDEPVVIKRRTPSQTERKLKKAARSLASRRRADLFTATRNTSDSDPFDETDQHSRLEDNREKFIDPSMEITQKIRGSAKDTFEIDASKERKQYMSQPEIDMLIKHSINKARQARKIAVSALEQKEKEQSNIEPKSRFDELTGMSPLGGKNRRFSWSSVEDMDDASTLDGAKSPKAALEQNDKSTMTVKSSPQYHEQKETSYVASRSDILSSRIGLRSTRNPYHQIKSTTTELPSEPKEVLVPASSKSAQVPEKTFATENSKKHVEELKISTVPSPFNIPSITSDRIYSQDEISAIVLLSMEKAQQAARDEIRSALLTPKATDPKSPMVAKLAARLRVPSQEEVTSIAREAMHRAREAAQDEIRNLIRESFRCAQDSSQEQIRQIVRESMQRARASAREEMSDLVRSILRQDQGGTLPERKPEMIEAERLLTARFKDLTVASSSAKTASRPSESSQPKQESIDEKERPTYPSAEREHDEKGTVESAPVETKQSDEMNITDTSPRGHCEHRLAPSTSQGERSLAGNLGLNMAPTPKSKFSFSHIDTQDADEQLEIQSHNQSTQGKESPENEKPHALKEFSSQVQTIPGVDDNAVSNKREPSGEKTSCDQTIDGTSSSVIDETDEVGDVQNSVQSLGKSNTQEEKASNGGYPEDLHENDGELRGETPFPPVEEPASAIETFENAAFETLATDSLVPLSDEPYESAAEEAPIESKKNTGKQSTEHGDVKRRTRRARYVSGMTSPLSSMTPSDASTHSSFSGYDDAGSITSVESRPRRKSRKNRYRSGKSEAVVTDEFLELIASKKGKRITAKDLGELIKQQKLNSPQSKAVNRLPKRNEFRSSQSFVTRPPASFEKQPRFCMVSNFMNFWEDLDLFLDEEEGSEYKGNEILSFSSHGGSYTEFEDDDQEDSVTEGSRFDPNVVLSFSLQPSEEEDSFVSEEEEMDVPKRRGWW